jgi:hypothetical protein
MHLACLEDLEGDALHTGKEPAAGEPGASFCFSFSIFAFCLLVLLCLLCGELGFPRLKLATGRRGLNGRAGVARSND